MNELAGWLIGGLAIVALLLAAIFWDRARSIFLGDR